MSIAIDMQPGVHRCCRCQALLIVGEPDAPWRCSDGCGEWLSCAAVDKHLFPAILLQISAPPPADSLSCVSCGALMHRLYMELYYLCREHGVWFDEGGRDVFDRVLSEEIARHRELRLQGSNDIN